MTVPGATTSQTKLDALNAQNGAVRSQQTLGVNDFLKLLTTQLQAQDPLKPMDDTQFISQMTSFTNLQQTQTLTSDLESFTKQQQITDANSYLGKTVSVTDAAGNNVSGVVSAISINAGAPMVTINNTKYSLNDITGVQLNTGTSGTASTPAATQPENAPTTSTPTTTEGTN
jgi:flagellar basal-body rod modification protein FlgD